MMKTRLFNEANYDWIAFYFCKDSRGDEYAVYPQDVRNRNGNTVVGLQSRYCYHDAYRKEYILNSLTPIPLDEVENTAIYKKVSDGEDRDIIAIDKNDAKRIMDAANPLSELKKVVNEYDILKGESKMKKCSMQKKIESLAKKQESISGKNLMDPEQFEKDIREMIDGEYEDILKGCDDKERQYYEMAWEIWDDCGYDYAGELYKKLQQQMYEYVSGNDYHMMGNFANIKLDWESDHEDGIKFFDLRKKLLDGVKDADTDEFSTWAIDWFFHAFGTYNMCYNFANDLGEEAATLEQEDEEERERENSDESKKRSEKRTVQPPSYDVYTYDELSDEAKERVKDDFLETRRELDGDMFQESCVETLHDLFPKSDLDVEYSLSYCQGDGFNTYGKLDVDDVLNVDLSKYPINNDKYITPLSNKDAIKAACEKAEISEIELPRHRDHYGYSLADRLELVPSYEVELSATEEKLLNEFEKFAQDVMGKINGQFETDGYDFFYEVTDEEVKDWADANDYEFTADGEID